MTKHAIKRCRERYGIHLSREGIEKLKGQVSSGSAILMGSSGAPNLKCYMAGMGGVVIRFVYDTTTGAIPTILPHDGPMRLNNRPWKHRV